MMLWIKVKTGAASLIALLIVGILTAFAMKAAAGSTGPAVPQPAAAIAPAAPRAGSEHNITVNGVTVPEVISQVHNAPEWKSGAAYKAGERVVNLKEIPAGAYECTQGGMSADPAPSGRGGSVKDGGGVTWRYLSDVDYTSLTGFLYDAPRWKKGTVYTYHDYVTFGDPLCSYRCGHPADGPSTVDPSQTDPKYQDLSGHWGEVPKGMTLPADGYLWEKMATIGYSSGKSCIPMEKFTGGYQHPTAKNVLVEMKGVYTAELWNDREYIAGQNGENRPLILENHKDNPGRGGEGFRASGGNDPDTSIKITAAPGESFIDHTDRPLRFDPASGVAILNPGGKLDRSPSSLSTGGFRMYTHTFGHETGLIISDEWVILDRIQVKSETAPAVEGWSYITFSNCLLQSTVTGLTPVVFVDCISQMDNCLVIGAGQFGVTSKYPMLINACTIVSDKPVADSIGFYPEIPWNKWVDGESLVSNTAIFGWSHAVGHGDHKYAPDWWNPKCADNATDTTDAKDQPRAVIPDVYPKDGIRIDPLPGAGNHFGAPFDKTTFVEPGTDWRLVPDSPLKGIGIQLGQSHPPATPRRGY